MQIAAREVPPAARRLQAEGLSVTLARILAARGVQCIDELRSDLSQLPSFDSLKGVAAAAQRLLRALRDAESILIIADYDADGATACAVGMLGLQAMGAQVDYLVPNRKIFGYGLTPEIVALAAQRKPRVIITVDNGIASVDGVATANALGIEVIVTDHHLPGPALPKASCIVNPNQQGCTFPSKNIAGVGVMFYLLIALRSQLRESGILESQPALKLARLLDLVALGTVADVVRLDRVNRILVHQGLVRIRAGQCRPGLLALMRLAGRDWRSATADDLGFALGPRLNAAGRLADMSRGIACLLAEDEREADATAEELDQLNRERRAVEAQMHDSALMALAEGPPEVASSLCVYRPEWHPGVIGVLASRLKDRFHLPTIAFAPGRVGELKGSGRSIAGFHLRDALDLVAKRAPGLITQFGGHAAAAGLTLEASGLARFRELFEELAREWLTADQLRRCIETDGSLEAHELSLEFAQSLAQYVWGQGFPAPLFDDEFAVREQRLVGGRHRRLLLARSGGSLEAIAFNCPEPLPGRIRALYRPEVNEFRGQRSLQLLVKHWEAV